MKHLLPIFAEGSNVMPGDESLNGGRAVCATCAPTRAEREAHAKFIATACNAHDTLVAALELASTALAHSTADRHDAALKAVRTALALITPATLTQE